MLAGVDADAMLGRARRERRAVRLRVGGEERWIAADDAGLYRDALGAVPPGGLPEAFLADVDRRARAASLRRYARTHGPFTTERAARPLRRRPDERAGGARARRRPRPRRAAPGRHRARVVRPRGAAPPAPRLARRAAQGDRGRRPARARRVPAVAGRASTATRPPAPASTACARCSCRCRGSRCPPRSWERDVLPRRVGAYSPTWLDQLCAVRRGRLGRRRRARAQLRPRRAVLPRGRRGARRPGRRPPAAEPPGRARRTTLLRERLAQAPCFFTDLLAELDARARGAPGGAVGPRLGGRGRPTTRSRRCARRA